MAIPDTIERAQEPVAIPLAANALAAGVTAADAVDAPASPIPLAASVSVPAPAADPRPEAKREQKPKPATPSPARSEEHTSELQSLMRISYAVFCLKKKNLTKQLRN